MNFVIPNGRKEIKKWLGIVALLAGLSLFAPEVPELADELWSLTPLANKSVFIEQNEAVPDLKIGDLQINRGLLGLLFIGLSGYLLTSSRLDK